MKLDFDEEKLKNRIWYFKDDHDRMPYLICSEETMNRLNPGNFIHTSFINTIVLKGSLTTTDEDEHKTPIYRGCKVFNDNDLPLGEIILG